MSARAIAAKKSRESGKRYEYKTVRMHRNIGVDAYRIPLSGSCQNFKGDVIIAGEFEAEVKARAADKKRGHIKGLGTLYKMLGIHDVLFIWAKGQKKCHVFMTQDMYLKLIDAYTRYHNKGRETTCETPTLPNKYQNEYYGGVKRCEE